MALTAAPTTPGHSRAPGAAECDIPGFLMPPTLHAITNRGLEAATVPWICQ